MSLPTRSEGTHSALPFNASPKCFTMHVPRVCTAVAGRAAQETYRVERVEGRLVLDVLRHALTACSLASFSLADCAQSLLVCPCLVEACMAGTVWLRDC